MPKTVKVFLQNSAAGVRYVHTSEGKVDLPPARDGQAFVTPDELEILEADLWDKNRKSILPDGVSIWTPPPPEEERGQLETDATAGQEGDSGQSQDDGESEAQFVIPDDLADSSKPDGMIVRAELIKVAEAEEVAFESDDNKAAIVAKIAAARKAKAEAQA